MLWAWEKLAGDSDLALRLPSMAFAAATPLLILACGHGERRVRLLWAGIMALWIPGALFAGEARPYSLLILLATGQVIALARFLARPNERGACLWAAISALMILTHYHALLITGLQGLAILARGRAAWRSWRALFLFVPAAGWMVIHLPLVLSFAGNTKIQFYEPLHWYELGAVPRALFGIEALGFAILLLAAATTLWSLTPWGPRNVRAAFRLADVTVVLTGVLAILLIVALGMVRPSFSPRYLLLFAPAMLFGLALWMEAWRLRLRGLDLALLGLLALPTIGEAQYRIAHPGSEPLRALNLENPSRYIGAAGAKRLLFALDGPGTTIHSDRAMLGDVGGFALRQAGHPIAILPVILATSREDPNHVLIRAADRPGDAILWWYDSTIHDTRGAVFPARIATIDPRWTCRDFGKAPVTILACVRR